MLIVKDTCVVSVVAKQNLFPNSNNQDQVRSIHTSEMGLKLINDSLNRKITQAISKLVKITEFQTLPETTELSSFSAKEIT